MGDPHLVPQSDASLVLAYTAGDRSALAGIYDRYADRLFDVAAAMMRDRHEAADVVQDTFLVAAERMGQLREPDRLKAWLFAIARHEIYRRTKRRSRAIPTDFNAPGVVEMAAAVDPAADGEGVAYEELAELVRSAAAGLDERDQLVLELSVRQGLQGADLAAALGISAEQSYTVVHRARERVDRSLGALTVARAGRKDCPELAELLRGWDGTFSILIRKRVARHVEGCSTCERTKRKVAPLVLLGDAAALAAPPDLRDRVLGRAGLPGSAPARASTYDFGNEGGFPRAITSMARRVAVVFGIAAAVLLLFAGGGIAISKLSDADRVELRSAEAPLDTTSIITTTSGTMPTPTTGASTVTAADPTTGPTTDPTTDPTATIAVETAASTVPQSTVPARSPSDPPVAPPTIATVAPAVTVAPVTPTTRPPRATVPPTVAPTAAPTTSPPPPLPTDPPPAPGHLTSSGTGIDLGAGGTAGSVTLGNSGGQSISYSVTGGSIAPFAVTGGGSGSLSPGQTTVLSIGLARSGLAEGTYTAALALGAGGTTTTVQLSARQEVPPTVRISTPARDAVDCQKTPPFVGATITDASGVAGATLTWVQAGGATGSSPMAQSPTNGAWGASIALANAPGVWTYTVIATDGRGNSSTASNKFVVQHCPD